MYLREEIRKRKDRLDWTPRAQGCKFAARGCCQVCGRKFPYPFYGLEVHHNTYERLGNELPSDLIALCSGCHAIFEWARRESPHLEIEGLRFQTALERLRVRLEDVDPFYRQHLREMDVTADELNEKASQLLAMSESG